MPRGSRAGGSKKKELEYRMRILSRRKTTAGQKSRSQDSRGSCLSL
ncbi:SPIDR isoform 3 [Pongo abelii]|uniref:SPIDR isoform 3 n=1 Tax=Pongo abelii TaxID=9601 RepID=A0A2J8UMW2_PONAB|nr:SPIDR isoform 3 [Pongo abelii]